MEKKVKVAVEFEPTRVRHMVIQCPGCERWFNQYSIANENIEFENDISVYAWCVCPACGAEFNLGDVEFEYPEFPEFYDKCAKKKTVWE